MHQNLVREAGGTSYFVKEEGGASNFVKGGGKWYPCVTPAYGYKHTLFGL